MSKGSAVSLLECDPHLVAGLLKVFLIELPEPLLTFDLYDEFIEAAGEKLFSSLPPQASRWGGESDPSTHKQE